MALQPGLAFGEEALDQPQATGPARRQRDEDAPNRIDRHPQAAGTRRSPEREREWAGRQLGNVAALDDPIRQAAWLMSRGRPGTGPDTPSSDHGAIVRHRGRAVTPDS